MKKLLIYCLVITLSNLSLAGCAEKSGDNSAATESSLSVRESEASESASESAPEPSQVQPEQDAPSAVFALGLGAQSGTELRVGDTVGEWTLADLQISYSEDESIHMLEALFTGEVALTGMLCRSALTDGFDFRVAPEDEEKMPCYISPDMAQKDAIWFMPDIPEEYTVGLDLDYGDELACRITVSSYRFIFAYMTAPASAVVTELEGIG